MRQSSRLESLDFALLADRPEAIPKIARWYFDEWGERSPGATVATICANLEKYLNRAAIPLLVLAVDGSDMLGVASLKYREMDIFPDKEHWLGGVYVPAMHRGRKVASRLIEYLVEKGQNLNVSTLHLQTDRLDGGLYRQLGWKESERVTYRGREVLVMERRLRQDNCMQ
jgi:GNAT superfamily N-acetyltransferase